MIGPVQLEAKIHFRIGDQLGCVTYSFPVGEPVTEQDLLVAIGKSLTSVREQLDQCELLDAQTFFNAVLVAEKTGRRGNFAAPSSFDYDTLKLEADAFEAMQQVAA